MMIARRLALDSRREWLRQWPKRARISTLGYPRNGSRMRDVNLPPFDRERNDMLRSIPRPSPAMVIACLALAVALSGTSLRKFSPAAEQRRHPAAEGECSDFMGEESPLLAVDFAASCLASAVRSVDGGRGHEPGFFHSLADELSSRKGRLQRRWAPVAAATVRHVSCQPTRTNWLVQTARARTDSTLVGSVICETSSARDQHRR
jgi:hypothetical protein